MKEEKSITVIQTGKVACILAGIRFQSFSFAFLDTCNNLSDSLFSKHSLRARFGKEYIFSENPNYKIVLCHVRKKDAGKFFKVLDDLVDKMHICGHPDYEKFCENAIETIATANKNTFYVQA